MIIGLIGSRDFTNYELFSKEVERICAEKEWIISEIVSGGAEGADRLAWQYAITKKIKLKEFPADWKQFGKRAGHIRNTDIVNYADVIIAFWDMFSKGTKDSIDKAILQGKSLVIVNVNTLGKKD